MLLTLRYPMYNNVINKVINIKNVINKLLTLRYPMYNNVINKLLTLKMLLISY